MQQTETLKLNLIETGDPISPVPLNENAEKIEAAILTGDAALDARVTVLEAKKLAVGTYTIGLYETLSIQVGFTPIAVLVSQSQRFAPIDGLVLPGDTNIPPFIQIVEGGFTSNVTITNTAHSGTYNYIAFG